MPHSRYLNLVFQGGGVRAIAYAGLLEALPSHIDVRAVAGTSAGSIVAALLALDKSSREITEILRRNELRNLVEEVELRRMERFYGAWEDLKKIWVKQKNGDGKVSLPRAIAFAWSHSQTFDDLKEVWNRKGLHSSNRLRRFFDTIFENKRFSDIKTEDLKIVAADVNRRSYHVYSKLQNLGTPIAEAVHASVSIPIFFEPFISGTSHLVDGGVLSNFPSFLFAQGHFPTVGFKLVDFVAPPQVDSTQAYLKALLWTMVDAHDKDGGRGKPLQHFTSFEIATPPHIPATKFALSDADIEDLYRCGCETAKKIDWDKCSSETRVVNYYDPRADETLKFSLEQAHSLFREYDERGWVDRLEQQVQFRVCVKNDWSVEYVTQSTFTIEGNKQIPLTRFIGSRSALSATEPSSLMDFAFIAQELLSNNDRKDLIRIPAYNDRQQKGFLLFYVPPISSSEARTNYTCFEIPEEFANTVNVGREDSVSYSAHRLAEEHLLRLHIEILIDNELPSLRLDPGFGHRIQQGSLVEDPKTKRVYRMFSAPIPEHRVIAESLFTIKIERGAAG